MRHFKPSLRSAGSAVGAFGGAVLLCPSLKAEALPGRRTRKTMPKLSRESCEEGAARRGRERSKSNTRTHGFFLIDRERSRARCSVPLETCVAELSARREEQDFRAGEHTVCPRYCREAESPLDAARCQPRAF